MIEPRAASPPSLHPARKGNAIYHDAASAFLPHVLVICENLRNLRTNMTFFLSADCAD
jgi:hypothetical protein